VPLAPKPLLTYSRCPKVPTPPSVTAELSSPIAGPTPTDTSVSSDLHIPIAYRKDKQSCANHPISDFVSYDRLTQSFRQFALSLPSVPIPRSYEEALLVSAWKHAMDEKM
jgi:hypothetical protein